jgi:hypothetical protein
VKSVEEEKSLGRKRDLNLGDPFIRVAAASRVPEL